MNERERCERVEKERELIEVGRRRREEMDLPM